MLLRAVDPLPHDAPVLQRLAKGLGILLLLAALAQFVGAMTGGKDWMQPLKHIRLGGSGTAVEATEQKAFIYVDTLDAVEEQIARAASQGKTTMLDFYADWCVDCKRMDKYTFPGARGAAGIERCGVT